MASKTYLNPDDPKQISTDSNEIKFSRQDIAANQLSSIIDAVPRLSLESKETVPISLSIDQIIEEIKLLDERLEKAKEKSATSTEFDKIRREISRQRMDLIRQGQTLSFMEFQKLHKEQRVRFRTQTKCHGTQRHEFFICPSSTPRPLDGAASIHHFLSTLPNRAGCPTQQLSSPPCPIGRGVQPNSSLLHPAQ